MDRDGMARSGPAALAGLLLLGCGGEGPAAVEPREEEERPLPDPVTLTAVLNENQVVPDLAGEDCAPISSRTDPATSLFLNPTSAAFQGACDPDNIFPVTAPDGHQVTFGEWDEASGTITVTCLEEDATRFDVEFEGLIADGVYTIWHFLSANQAGALASHPDEINNVFVADAAGSVSASVVGTPGPMTFSGTAPACQLPVPPGEAVRFGVHMVMLYHTDNQSWGPRSGPEETVIAHLFVMGE